MPQALIAPLPLVARAAFAAALVLSFVAGLPRPVHADQGGFRGGHEFREHEFHREQFRDSRYHHDHYYPPRGYRFNVLPPHSRVIVHGGQPFYFAGGVWYRPVQNTFVVVRPPAGIIVPVLPAFYTRIWVGPYPYYYANDTYYLRNPQGYVVVDPPPGAISMAPPPGMPVPPDDAVTELGPADNGMHSEIAGPLPAPAGAPAPLAQGSGGQIFIYPRQGQSPEQQKRDRAECDNWAAGQTGHGSTNASGQGQLDPDYLRALGACLDGRGYTSR